MNKKFHKQTVVYSKKNSEIFLKKFPEIRILTIFFENFRKKLLPAKCFCNQ